MEALIIGILEAAVKITAEIVEHHGDDKAAAEADLRAMLGKLTTEREAAAKARADRRAETDRLLADDPPRFVSTSTRGGTVEHLFDGSDKDGDK